MDVAFVAEQKGVNLCINILETHGKTQMSPTYVNRFRFSKNQSKTWWKKKNPSLQRS